MKRILHTLFFALLINFSFSQNCGYSGGSFENFTDLRSAYIQDTTLIEEGILISPQYHIPFVRALAMLFSTIFIDVTDPLWAEVWNSGFGLSQSTDAKEGNYSLKITGDAGIAGADLYSVHYCDRPIDSITFWYKHIGSGNDTFNIYFYQDSLVGASPMDSSDFDRFASYGDFYLYGNSTDSDWKKASFPANKTGNNPEADTVIFFTIFKGNETHYQNGGESYFLIDDMRLVSNEVFQDQDMDGFASNVDCNDVNANVNPGVTETPYDGVDNDCNASSLDDDLDQDGYILANDCNDVNANVNPGVTETPYDGVDNDCNASSLDDDLDQDGYLLANDCNDVNENVNPGVTEAPYDGVDNDCNASSFDDDLDQDGYLLANDCNDMNASINPVATEIPNNGIDEDCDGLDLMVSTEDNSPLQVRVWPNPFKESLFVESDQPISRIFIFNEVGLLVTDICPEHLQATLDDKVKNLKYGFYMLKVELKNGQTKICKLIKN